MRSIAIGIVALGFLGITTWFPYCSVFDARDAREVTQDSTLTPKEALAEFAEGLGIVPIDPFNNVRAYFTTELQDLEGQIVAMRLMLIDVVREAPDVYELVLGDPRGLSGTVVTLTAGSKEADQLIAMHRNYRRPQVRLFVVAKVGRVTPIDGVSDEWPRPRRISGVVQLVQLEGQ